MRLCVIVLAAGLGLSISSSLLGQAGAGDAGAPAITDSKPMPVDAGIKAVTLYLGRASITRSASVDLRAGVYDVIFSNLPGTIQPQSIQARASGGGGAKVISVDYAQQVRSEASSPVIAQQDARIEAIQRQIKELADGREVLKSQGDFLRAIAAKSAAESGKDSGSNKLDLEALRKQMAFIADEHTRLAAAGQEIDVKHALLEKQLKAEQARRTDLAGVGNVERTASVTVVATEAGRYGVDLTYLVADATWQPRYNIRASVEGGSTLIEYDAVLTQRSGEDWNDVKLTLSTAQPAVAANPPTLEPWFVDVQRPHTAGSVSEGLAMSKADHSPRPAAPAPAREVSPDDKAQLDQLSRDASVAGSGPSVTFEIPRIVSVKSNAQKQQQTRLASIDTSPEFVHVAVPVLGEAVYLRGDLTNSSPYQFLPGPASIFVDQDYVGPTSLGWVAPAGAFKLYFGIDRAVKASRQIVTKKTENTGLLSGGRRTSYNYRIEIDNGSGKALTIELWDRVSVSRSEDIQIELVDLSHPLATDAQFVNEERPTGLLKWTLHVPANASGKNALAVTWGVRINRAKDVEMTPLPE